MVPALHVRAVSLRSLSFDWDDFAARSGASWRSSSAQVRFLRWRYLHRSRFVALVVDDNASGRRIAQCIVEVRNGVYELYDGLLLLAEDEARRSEATLAVLRFLGAGRYRYGWTWSVKPPAESLLAAIPGVKIETVRPLIFHAVDFSGWDSWSDYMASISVNVRRNVKKACKSMPDLDIREHHGRGVLKDLLALVQMLRKTSERLGRRTLLMRVIFRQLLAIAPRSDLAVSIVARGGGAVLAALFGYEFGDRFYYWQGGSISDNGGGSWALLLYTVERWYARYPLGTFLMGFFDETLSPVRREGLLRQRASLRATAIRTSIVDFAWSEAGQDISAHHTPETEACVPVAGTIAGQRTLEAADGGFSE